MTDSDRALLAELRRLLLQLHKTLIEWQRRDGLGEGLPAQREHQGQQRRLHDSRDQNLRVTLPDTIRRVP